MPYKSLLNFNYGNTKLKLSVIIFKIVHFSILNPGVIKEKENYKCL